jgi:hypothetical protein
MNIRLRCETADGTLASRVTARDAGSTQGRHTSSRHTSGRDTSGRDTGSSGPGGPGGPGARRTEWARRRPPRGKAREASRPRLWPPVRNGRPHPSARPLQ